MRTPHQSAGASTRETTSFSSLLLLTMKTILRVFTLFAGRLLPYLVVGWLSFVMGTQLGANQQVRHAGFHQQHEEGLVIRLLMKWQWTTRVLPGLRPAAAPAPAPPPPAVELSSGSIEAVAQEVSRKLQDRFPPGAPPSPQEPGQEEWIEVPAGFRDPIPTP